VTTGIGPTDLVAIFSTVFGEISSVRASRGLPVLLTHVGAEWLQAEEDAPRLVIVPERMQYVTARNLGNPTGQATDWNPKPTGSARSSLTATEW
jgi:cAMP phosphodiesterase